MWSNDRKAMIHCRGGILMRRTLNAILALICFLLAAASIAQPLRNMTADEADVAAIFKAGKLTDAQKDQIVQLMVRGHYYGMEINSRHLNKKRGMGSARSFAGNTPSRIRSLINVTGPDDKLTDVYIHLWREPSPGTASEAQKLAKAAIHQMYNQILALKGQFPELARLDKETFQITDTGVYLKSEPMQKTGSQKVHKPLISIKLQEPDLGRSYQMVRSSTIYPHQKLQLVYSLLVENKQLCKYLWDIVDKATEPLANTEKKFGSEPVEALL